MSPGTAHLTRSRLTTVVLLAGIAGFVALYLASVGPYWNISPDSADYVGWGRSLASGHGWGKPPINPPMTPFAFAAVVRLFPTGYSGLNALTPLLIFLSFGGAYRLLARRGDPNVALLSVLLSLACIPVLHASTQLLSEPVYLALSMGALLLLDGYREREGETGPPPPRPFGLQGWVAGILMVATALARTIGIAIAIAVLLVEGAAWLRRRRMPNPLLSVFALASLASVPLWQAYSGAGYASGWFRMFVARDPFAPSAGALSVTEFLARVRDHLHFLPKSGGMLLNGVVGQHHTLDFLLQVAGTLAIAWGLWLALRRRVRVTEVYLVLYLLVVAAHMVVGGGGDYRFLVPVAPLLFYYALEAVRWFGGYQTPTLLGRGATILLGVAGALYLVGYLRIGGIAAIRGVYEAHSSPFGDYPIKRTQNFDAQRLALWLQRNSGPQDRYAAAQRDMFDVLTERHGDDILLSYTHPREEFIARLDQGRVRYLIVDRSGAALGDSLQAVVRAYPARFRLIWELPRASLYEVTPESKQ